MDAVANNSPLTVVNVSQIGKNTVEYNSQHYPDDGTLVRVAFYPIPNDAKTRKVVALHGFMLNALMLAIGATQKSEVPKWLTSQAAAIDNDLPLTWQVQRLIVKALIKNNLIAGVKHDEQIQSGPIG
jgi:hypothetical protein